LFLAEVSAEPLPLAATGRDPPSCPGCVAGETHAVDTVGAIRLGPVATVRFAGPDRYWDGCHDFGKLSAREANRTQPARIGPRRDEIAGERGPHLQPGYRAPAGPGRA